MNYGLTKKEKEELKGLQKDLFGKNNIVVLDEETNPDKVYRYNFLVKKKMDLIQATLN